MTNSKIYPKNAGSYLFELEEFGFGKTDESAQTEYYENLMNSDESTYGFYANSTNLALEIRGLGLPMSEFDKFAHLLSIITKGESTCIASKSGYCALS